MRKIFACAAAAVGLAVVALAAPASAGERMDFVCWTQPSGIGTCAYVPEPYRVSGLPFKPHSHRAWARCKHCAVDFKLDHHNIRDLGEKVDNTTMRTYHDATLFGSKRRPHAHH